MGLKLTLDRVNNNLDYTFVDAYWAIDNINYSTEYGEGDLYCYPSREAKLKDEEMMSTPTIEIGAPILPAYNSKIYHWSFEFKLMDVFPSGIPLDGNAQKTAIYNWIKSYTQLPFEDVIED